MGRLNLRAAWGWPEFDWALINEPKGGAACSAHLLNFDSVQGRWAHEARADGASAIVVESRGDAMGRSSIMNTLEGPAPSGPSRMIDRQHAADDTEVDPPGAVRTENKSRIAFTEYSKPGDIPWADHGVDIVLECSGRFRKPEDLQVYFERGVKKVIVAAPVKGGGALNLVMGVNDHLYEPARHHLLTNASCTTNCLAPVVKVIHEGIGIERGVVTTIHDITNTQTLVDRPDKDLRRARAAGLSLIPTTTGSATAIGLIYPELLGKLNGHAVRVPLLGGSLTDCAFAVKRPTTVDEVNALLRAASEVGPLRGILGYEERPLVSIDFKGDPRSAIIDGPSTMVVDGTLVKIYAWYDNEWGYCNRMMELTRKVAASL